MWTSIVLNFRTPEQVALAGSCRHGPYWLLLSEPRAVQLRTIMNLLEDLPNAIQNAKNVEDSLLASSLSFGAYPSPFPFQ